jgi:hypothetical protein
MNEKQTINRINYMNVFLIYICNLFADSEKYKIITLGNLVEKVKSQNQYNPLQLVFFYQMFVSKAIIQS